METTPKVPQHFDRLTTRSVGWVVAGLVGLTLMIVSIEGVRGVYEGQLPLAVPPVWWFATAILTLILVVVSIAAAAGPLLMDAATQRLLKQANESIAVVKGPSSRAGGVNDTEGRDKPGFEANWVGEVAFSQEPSPKGWPAELKERLAKLATVGDLTKPEWDVVTRLQVELAVISSRAAGARPPTIGSVAYAAWSAGETIEELRAWIRVAANLEPPAANERAEGGSQ